MLIKLTGTICIIFGTSLLGIYYSNILKKRVEVLKEFYKILALLEAQLEYNNTICEAFNRITTRFNNAFSYTLKVCQNMIKTNDYDSFHTIWEKSILSNSQLSCLKKEDKDEIIQFGKTIGFLNKKNQLENIAISKKNINILISASMSSVDKNSKIYKAIGITAGFLIVIILY